MIEEKKEKKIIWLSFIAGAIFAFVEFIYAIYSHSHSVLMDGIYDGTELIFIGLILFLTPLLYQPISEKHPYGFYQMEPIFLIIKSFMMLAVTVSVSIEIIESLLSGGNMVNEVEIALFQFVNGSICIFIYLIMKKMNESVSSLTVKAELIGWRMDCYYSLGMSLAFVVASLLNTTALSFIAPYFDQFVAIVVICLTLPDTLRILKRSIKDVFLFPPNDDTVNVIKEICNKELEKFSFSAEFYDITRTGRHMWVSVYFNTKDQCLDVNEYKRLTNIVNEQINKMYDNCTCEFILKP